MTQPPPPHPQGEPPHWPPPTWQPPAGPPSGWQPPAEPLPEAQRQAWPPPAWPAPSWPPPTPRPPAWAPPPAPVLLPDEPREYPQLWKTPGILAWRPIVIVALGTLAFIVVGVIVVLMAVAVESAVTGQSLELLFDELLEGRMTPGALLGNSVSLGLLIPLSLLLAKLSGQPSRYLHSVAGRFRWKLFWPAALIATVLMTGLVVVGLLLGDAGELRVYGYSWALFVVLLLVTPFQAAGEEYLLRGLLFRAAGSFFRSRWWALGVGGIVNSVVFMAVHGAGDLWLNFTYLTMGLLLSYITWRTGGLEAAVAIHLGNNLLAVGLLAFQDLGAMLDRAAGAGDWTVLVQLAVIVVATAAIEWVARRQRVVVASAPAAEPPVERRLGGSAEPSVA